MVPRVKINGTIQLDNKEPSEFAVFLMDRDSHELKISTAYIDKILYDGNAKNDQLMQEAISHSYHRHTKHKKILLGETFLHSKQPQFFKTTHMQPNPNKYFTFINTNFSNNLEQFAY